METNNHFKRQIESILFPKGHEKFKVTLSKCHVPCFSKQTWLQTTHFYKTALFSQRWQRGSPFVNYLDLRPQINWILTACKNRIGKNQLGPCTRFSMTPASLMKAFQSSRVKKISTTSSTYVRAYTHTQTTSLSILMKGKRPKHRG